MRARLRLVLALAGVLIGCTSNSGSPATPVSCGAGTMLRGSVCVPAYDTGFAGAAGAGGADTTSLGCSSTQDACHQCIGKSCATQCTSCQGIPDCVAKLACVEGCNDDMCAAGCAEAYVLGAKAFDAFDGCLANSCAKACSGGAQAGSGGAAGAGPGLSCAGGSTDPCDQCGTQSCSSQCNACSAVPDCVSQVSCLSACSDQACVASCAAMYPAGTMALDAFAACLQKSCAQACGSSGGAGGGP